MESHLILLVAFLSFVQGLVLNGGTISLTTEMLVRRYGYPYEEYTVKTEDGYLLGLHRIPHSPNFNSSKPRPVAFFMHGLLCSSSDWVILGPNKSLPYFLSDAGYDVWLGNARGNTYSRKHISKSPDSPNFWNFSFHEIGIFDLPAMFNFVRNVTGLNKIRYFGHSQGTTSIMILTSLKPEFGELIESAHLLAPVVFMNHLTNRFFNMLAPILGNPVLIDTILKDVELRPTEELQKLFGAAFCEEEERNQPNGILCNNFLFLVAGFNSETAENSTIPDLMASSTAGSSINQLLHYLQEVNSGYFRQFDHGTISNLKYYNSSAPPNYPLQKVKMPVFLYYGLDDSLAAKIDVMRLVQSLNTTVQVYEVPRQNFDHLSFFYGTDVVNEVYNKVMDDLASRSSNI